MSVTTPTVTIATVAAIGVASLGAVAMIGLIVFLVAKELFATTTEFRFNVFSRHLSVAVIPLLTVFAFIVIMKVLQAIY
jgi:hypothetical protein